MIVPGHRQIQLGEDRVDVLEHRFLGDRETLGDGAVGMPLFATLSLQEMKTMGVGLAVAIALDATLVRLIMLPAVLTLLGERAWWPRRGSVVAQVRVEESDERFARLGL